MRTESEPGTLRLKIAAAIATTLALIAAVVIPIAANAATVELSGTVTGPTGKLLSGASVSAVEFALGVPTTMATTTTSSSGKYTFLSLPSGSSYSLQFGATSTTFSQYLGNTSDSFAAQLFTLTDSGGSHSTINAALSASGTISGSIKSITHAALKGYTVRAYANGSDDTIVRSGVSSSSGAYSVTGLEPGSYQLEAIDTGASPPYGPVYSGGAVTLDAADTVQVIAGAVTPYSFTLGKAGAISGTVTGETDSSAQPLADVTVTPYLLEGTSPSFTGSSSLGLTPVVTNAEGEYSIKGLMPGYYTLDFSPGASTPVDPSDGNPYARTLLGNANYRITQAPALHVVGGTTVSGADVQLYREATVTVTVVDGVSNEPVSNIQVSLAHEYESFDANTDGMPTGITNVNGQYTFEGVGPGYYEAIVGSNLGTDGTITTYQRAAYALSDQVITGGSVTEQVAATLKAVGGLQATSTPTISCCSSPPYSVGDALYVDGNSLTWTNDDVNSEDDTYQWYRDGDPIPGATSYQYVLQSSDAGQTLFARITAYDVAYGSGTADTAVLGPIQNGTIYANDGGGGLYGSSSVGDTLTYSHPGWSNQAVTETDVWQQSIDSGSTWHAMAEQPTDYSYKPVASDVGSEIRVEVTGTAPGYNTVTYATNAATIYLGQLKLLTQPKLTTSSTKWTDSGGSWSPNLGTTNYIWEILDKTTGDPTYVGPTTVSTLSRAGRAGDFVGVRANRQPDGYSVTYSTFLTAQTGSAPTPSASASITGTPQYNTTLTADVPSFAPPVTSVACKWQYKSGSSWKNISGGTSCTYTPLIGDIGHILRVEETTTLFGFASTTITATEPTAIAALPLTNTVAPVINGTKGTGDVVTAGSGSWSTTPSGYSFHWKYSATGLAPFTTAPGTSNQGSYTIPQSLLNDVLEVDVTASLAGHVSTTVTASAGAIPKGVLTELTLPKVKLSGTTLTASGGTFSPAPTAVLYYWSYFDSNDANPTYFGGTTATQSIAGHEHAHIDVQAIGNLTGYGTSGYTYGADVLAKKGDEVPTGTLTISGGIVATPIVSSGLTWSAGSSIIGYQWQYESGTTWKSISGATLTAFSPTATYLGKKIRVLETASHTNYNSDTVTSSNTVTVTSGNAPVPGTGGNAPVLSNSNQVNLTLSITPGTWSLPGVTFGYQWQTSTNGSTWTNLTGETSSHLLVPQSAYLTGSYVGVVITASKSGYTPGTTRVSTPERTFEGYVGLVTCPSVKVSGTKLTVSNGTWKDATSYDYAWVAEDTTGDTESVGTDANTYTPGAGDAGKAIFVSVTASADNYLDLSCRVLARGGGPITATGVTITGTPSTGFALTASWTSFSVSFPDVAYQWYRNGATISGAISQTYAPVTADVGKILSVKLTVSNFGWTTEKFSAATTTVQSDASLYYVTSPVISGTPKVDDVLTTSAPTWTESGVTTKYQWYRGGLPIAGATEKSYTVTAADLGYDISVQAIGTKPNRPSRNVSGGSLTITAGAVLAPHSPVKISGTVGFGKVLTASMGTWNFPVTLTYEWDYEGPSGVTWNPINGANASTYTPNAGDALPNLASGGHIELIVRASRPGHDSVELTSTEVTLP